MYTKLDAKNDEFYIQSTTFLTLTNKIETLLQPSKYTRRKAYIHPLTLRELNKNYWFVHAKIDVKNVDFYIYSPIIKK